MKTMIGRMRERFDFIIIDTPPVLAVNDPALVATFADLRVVVASTDETSLSDIDRVVEMMSGVNRPVDGVVLNRFDAQRAYGYTYGSKGYGYGVYQYGSSL